MVRNCIWSDGRLQVWRWPDHLGNNYMGPQVQYSEKIIKITAVEKVRLEAAEKRRKLADDEIRRNRG